LTLTLGLKGSPPLIAPMATRGTITPTGYSTRWFFHIARLLFDGLDN